MICYMIFFMVGLLLVRVRQKKLKKSLAGIWRINFFCLTLILGSYLVSLKNGTILNRAGDLNLLNYVNHGVSNQKCVLNSENFPFLTLC